MMAVLQVFFYFSVSAESARGGSTGMTIFFVSHEMAFVREVSSKVIFMADGNIVESGTPAQIFDAPQQPRTRDFVGKILRL